MRNTLKVGRALRAAVLATATSLGLSLGATMAVAQNLAGYSGQDLQLMWETAAAGFNGNLYDYTVYRFDSESAARDCASNVFIKCNGATSSRKYSQRYNEMPYQAREAIAALEESSNSPAMPDAAGTGWQVVVMNTIKPSTFGKEIVPLDWLRQHALTALPAPDVLRTDPRYVAQRELNKIRSADDLQRALADGRLRKTDLDGMRANGITPVLWAVYRKDPALLNALLAAGASADSCGITDCPLATAILLGRNDDARTLLAHKANPAASPRGIPPLMAAASVGNREITQQLLDAGASPLISHTEQAGFLARPRSILYYTSASDTAYQVWLHQLVQTALEKQGKSAWTASIEQGGVRHPLRDGGVVILKRQPFRLVMSMGEDVNFAVMSSEDARLLEMRRDQAMMRDMTHEARYGAASADSSFLSLPKLEMDGTRLSMTATINDLSYNADPGESRGTRRVLRNGAVEYVYEVTELITDSAEQALPQYRGPGFHMVMGTVPRLGTGIGFFKPVGVTIRFAP